MIEEKKAPTLRFKGFTDKWEHCKLKQIAKKVSVGIATSSSMYFSSATDGVPFIKNQNIKEFGIDDTNIEYISKEFDKANASKRVAPGDILTIRTGYPGKSVVVPENLANAQTFTTLITRLKSGNPQFVVDFINSNYGKKQISAMQAGGAQVNVNANVLKNLRLALPTTSEQEKIVSLFKRLDTTIILQQQKLNKLDLLRKSLLQKVFANDNEETPELRFNRFQDSWNQKKLGSLFTESKHKSENGQLLSVSITRGVYPFDPTERKNNSSTNKANYKFVEKNDIAYNSMRMWQGAEGVSHYSGIVSPAYTVLHPKETTNPEFFAYMFKRADMLNKFRRYSQGLTSDTWNLKFPVLKTISVKTTNLQEQEKIVKLFKTLEDNSNLQRQKLERYKQLKKFLLQQMFI